MIFELGDRGFYLTADIHQAMKWAKQIAKKTKGDPAVVRFKIDRQDLEELFDYKRFDVGDYQHWYNFTGLSRSGYDHHRFDIVEGPYRAKNRKGAFTKPTGHQLGLFTERAVKYFDDHIISMSCQLPKLLEGLSLN